VTWKVAYGWDDTKNPRVERFIRVRKDRKTYDADLRGDEFATREEAERVARATGGVVVP